MAEQKTYSQSLADGLLKLVVTFFYAGEIPICQGTVASFIGLLFFVCVSSSPFLSLVIFLIITALGFFCSGSAEKLFGKKDPGQIVIDEVCGIFLVFLGIPLSWKFLLAGFILYRIFDIFKPFPLKRLEKLPGSFGIMADDLLAGIYANILLHIFANMAIFKV